MQIFPEPNGPMMVVGIFRHRQILVHTADISAWKSVESLVQKFPYPMMMGKCLQHSHCRYWYGDFCTEVTIQTGADISLQNIMDGEISAWMPLQILVLYWCRCFCTEVGREVSTDISVQLLWRDSGALGLPVSVAGVSGLQFPVCFSGGCHGVLYGFCSLPLPRNSTLRNSGLCLSVAVHCCIPKNSIDSEY